MNALTATPHSKTTSPQLGPDLSAPLKSWLLVERSDQQAIETINRSDILRAEAEQAMPALREAALTPATEDQIRQIIGARFALFPQPQRNDGQWAAWWADYYDALRGLTPYAVEAGMAAWVRSPEAEFMAKPGKLRELALTVPNENVWARAHRRAQIAARPVATRQEPSEPEPEEKRPSPEEVKAMLADFRMKMAEKDTFRDIRAKIRPSPQARVDETGISAEARALMARQG